MLQRLLKSKSRAALEYCLLAAYLPTSQSTIAQANSALRSFLNTAAGPGSASCTNLHGRLVASATHSGCTRYTTVRTFASQAQRSQQRRQLQKKSSEQGVYLISLVVGMVGLTYASVPLYRCALASPFPCPIPSTVSLRRFPMSRRVASPGRTLPIHSRWRSTVLGAEESACWQPLIEEPASYS